MKLISEIEVLVLIIIAFVTNGIKCHGRLWDPPSRSTLWRLEEFNSLNPPKNYDDNGLNCGGYFVQHNVHGGKCGECGDPFGDPRPRANESGGGKYARGIIVRNYTAGSEIPISIELTANHKGHFEFRLCPNVKPNLPATQDCFDQHILSFANGTTKYIVHSGIRNFNFTVKLPEGVRCSNCVLQWNYRAGNNWGTCENGKGAVGCGPQETFRGCSDIAVK